MYMLGPWPQVGHLVTQGLGPALTAALVVALGPEVGRQGGATLARET